MQKNSLPYLTYNAFLKQKFGEPVLKIPVNAGFSCPNLDGTKGRGGCIFCDNRAFSPVHSCSEPVNIQLKRGIERSPARFKKYICYFQPYSNTHGPLEKLKHSIELALTVQKVVGIAIGTRPDCFSPEIYNYLGEVSKRTYLSVELGLQTVHDNTLEQINRCQTFAEGKSAIQELAKREIELVAHVILGLPGEDESMMMKTAKTLASLPVDGIKIHQLMVIKGTPMEQWYQRGRVQMMELDEYARLAAKFVSFLRPNQVIHRLMADCPPEAGLIAPLWCTQKSQARNTIRDAIVKSR
ncbi:MAG: TIGR01212 family radical SAM protein [Fibrobacteria bacterium]|nr:TIGR01212 family radical SAM protein [Fibrobacteria bacterium]